MCTFYRQCVHLQVEKIQISKLSSPGLDVISVYRSDKGNPNELLGELLKIITDEKATLITGDFNICYLRIPKNQVSKGLQGISFQQLADFPTHVMGGHIDHVYWRDSTGQWEKPKIERYSPYFSDHDGICVTLKKK